MNQLRHILRFVRNGQFLVVAAIFMLSILTFNILFDASSPDDYPRELLAALIGTIMAAVVTTLLLNQQSVGEELKERNVEVFRKKIAAYETFIDRALLHAEDGHSDDEVRELRRAIYSMSLVSGADTVGVLIDYVRANHVGDRDGKISDVIGAFRKELRLDELDDSTLDDLAAIESKLSGEVDSMKVEATTAALSGIATNLKNVLESKAPGILGDAEFTEPSGQGDGTAIILILPSNMICYISVPYGIGNFSFIDGHVEFEDVPEKMKKKLRALVPGLKLEVEEVDQDMVLFTLNLSERPEARNLEYHLTIDELADALIILERAAAGKQA